MHARRVALQVGRIKLVDQGAHQTRCRLRQHVHQFAAAGDARRRCIGTDHPSVFHHPRDLFVQLIPVSHDQHPGIGLVFKNPLGDQHHQNALAAALGVPDDAAFAFFDAHLRRFDPFELMQTRHLFVARIKHHKIAHQVEQTAWLAHLRQRLVQQTARNQIAGRARHAKGVVLPLHIKLLRRARRAVTQALRVVARQGQLHRAEKALVKDRLLVGDELANAVSHLDRTAFELQHHHGHAVDVEHHVGATLVPTFERDLLG